MFLNKLSGRAKLLQYQCSINAISTLQVNNVSTTEVLTPVPLAYATYESTDTPFENAPPPLLIVHGLLGSKGNWNSMCKALQQKTDPKRKIVAVDARNHGDSPHSESHTYEHLALDIKSLLHQLYIKKVCLLGHSMGGRAVMLFALRYPELVEKLIVADISPIKTSPNLKTMPVLFNALKSINLPKNIALSSARMNVDQQLARLIVDRGLRSFLLTNLVQKSDGGYAWRVNIDVLQNNFDKIAEFPSVANATFEEPVLFVAGGASDFLKKSDHPAILKLFPKAEFTYIEGAGHWIHAEKPAEFLGITTKFLNGKGGSS